MTYLENEYQFEGCEDMVFALDVLLEQDCSAEETADCWDSLEDILSRYC